MTLILRSWILYVQQTLAMTRTPSKPNGDAGTMLQFEFAGIRGGYCGISKRLAESQLCSSRNRFIKKCCRETSDIFRENFSNVRLRLRDHTGHLLPNLGGLIFTGKHFADDTTEPPRFINGVSFCTANSGPLAFRLNISS